MKHSKLATEVKAGDKIFLEANPSAPKEVTASYDLGTNWAIEVKGLQQILQVPKDAKLTVWQQ